MSLLRNTDVKKHLGRVVPRFVSTETENLDQANHDDAKASAKQTEATPVQVTAPVAQKAETN